MIKAGITVFSGEDPGIKLELSWDHDEFKGSSSQQVFRKYSLNYIIINVLKADSLPLAKPV